MSLSRLVQSGIGLSQAEVVFGYRQARDCFACCVVSSFTYLEGAPQQAGSGRIVAESVPCLAEPEQGVSAIDLSAVLLEYSPGFAVVGKRLWKVSSGK